MSRGCHKLSEHQLLTSIDFTFYMPRPDRDPATLLIFLFIFVADNKPMRTAARF